VSAEQNGIHLAFQCEFCLREIDSDPELDDVSPQEYGVLDVGVSEGGDLILYCRRHDVLVDRFPNETIAEDLRAIVGQGCSNPDCQCASRKETEH
jgi:hypothetical protein